MVLCRSAPPSFSLLTAIIPITARRTELSALTCFPVRSKAKLTSLPSVKASLDVRQQVRSLIFACSGSSGGLLVHLQPRMLKQLGRCRAVGGINGQAGAHEIPSWLRDVLPILFLRRSVGQSGEVCQVMDTDWLKLVVSPADSLHLLVLRVPIERCVATEQEVAGRSAQLYQPADGPTYVMTPIAQISTGLPWPAFLKISGY